MELVRPFDRALPGFGPHYARTELNRQPDGRWVITHYAGEAPGFITAADVDRYEDLSWSEAVDVLAAIYDSMGCA